MNHFLGILSFLVLLLPAACSLLTLLLGRRHNIAAENRVAGLTYATAILLVSSVVAMALIWLVSAKPQATEFAGVISIIDAVTIAYLVMTAFATLITIKFSRYYLHREPGYSRFFSIVFLFIFGMNLLTLSSTLQTFLVGWEIAGLSSFLLIAFYFEREQPVRHALRAFAVYRVTDAALLMAAVWLHSVEREGSDPLTLGILGSSLSGDPVLGLNPWSLGIISVLLVIAAAGKGAQWPFSSWLPRAMEGPTPSSAIFYGALSVHAGILLLLRTAQIWGQLDSARWLLGGLGFISAVVATGVGRTQSNIKGQIAYASITQVGLMMIELALGWPRILVLVHFLGNASLRTYQLLVSPSVVVHMLQMQTTRTAASHRWSIESWLPRRLQLTLYAFALNEGFLDYNPRYLGARLWWQRMPKLLRASVLPVGGVCTIGAFYFALGEAGVVAKIEAIGLIALMIGCAVGAARQRLRPLITWILIVVSQLSFGFLTLVLVHPDKNTAALFFLSGIIPAGILGGIIIRHLMKVRGLPRRDSGILYPDAVTLLLLATLALSAFPVTQACWGEEMLLGDLWLRLPVLTAACIVVLVWNGFILMRLFVGLCFGQARVGTQVLGVALASRVEDGAALYAGQGSPSGTFSM